MTESRSNNNLTKYTEKFIISLFDEIDTEFHLIYNDKIVVGQKTVIHVFKTLRDGTIHGLVKTHMRIIHRIVMSINGQKICVVAVLKHVVLAC